MNILVFFMSRLNYNAVPIDYLAGDMVITGTQTNEAAAKYLICRLSQNGERLEKIIAITIREAKKRCG